MGIITMKLLALLLATAFIGLVASDTPTVVPADPFDAFEDAKTLRKGIHRIIIFSSNKIVNVLCHRASSQRAEIADTYQTAYGITLKEDLEDTLIGNFEDITVALASSLPDFLAVEMNRILQEENCVDRVMEVLLSTRKNDMTELNKAYTNNNEKSLKEDIESKYTGSTQKLLSELSDGKDNSTLVVNFFVKRSVSKLYKAGEGMEGADEDVFIDIFANSGHNYLMAVMAQYESQYGSTIESVIQSELSEELANLLMTIVKYTKTKVTYLTERVHQTLDGLGTHERDLTRLIVSRCEIDLGDIKVEYENLYGRSLVSDIKFDTAGNFEKALRNLVG